MKVAPGLRCEDLAPVDEQQLIAPQDIAVLVDGADAVGIAVECDSEFGAVLFDGRDQVLQIGRDGGVGMVVGEGAVHIEEQLDGLAVEPLEQAVHGGAGGTVAGVEHDLDTAGPLELGGYLVNVGRDDVGCLPRALPQPGSRRLR